MNRPIALVALALGVVALASDASAVIGEPAYTPGGYASVARPNTGHAVATETSVAAKGATPVAAAATVTSLPGGCGQVTVANVVYQKCGQTYYRPYYQGTNVVYVPATP